MTQIDFTIKPSSTPGYVGYSLFSAQDHISTWVADTGDKVVQAQLKALGWSCVDKDLKQLVDSLTPVLREVLELTAKGFTTQEIADIHKVTVRAVESRRQRLYQLLNVGSIGEASVIAAKAGLV